MVSTQENVTIFRKNSVKIFLQKNEELSQSFLLQHLLIWNVNGKFSFAAAVLPIIRNIITSVIPMVKQASSVICNLPAISEKTSIHPVREILRLAPKCSIWSTLVPGRESRWIGPPKYVPFRSWDRSP